MNDFVERSKIIFIWIHQKSNFVELSK